MSVARERGCMTCFVGYSSRPPRTHPNSRNLLSVAMVHLHDGDERERRDMSFENRFLVPRLLGKLISWLLYSEAAMARRPRHASCMPLIQQDFQHQVRSTLLGGEIRTACITQTRQDLGQSLALNPSILITSILILNPAIVFWQCLVYQRREKS